MDHPYGKQYGQEGNPRAYMTMRDYRNLPYQWGIQQHVGSNPNPPRSMREYRDQWISGPVYHVPSGYPPPLQYDYPEPPFYASPPQSPQSPQPLQSIHPLEQAMLDLNRIMDDYVEANKKIRAHSIVTVEENLNKKIDGLKDDFEHKWDHLHDSSEDLIDQQQCPPEEVCQSGTRVEEQREVTVQANQETETVESSLNNESDGFQSKIDQNLDILQESISKLTQQPDQEEEKNFEEESQEEEYLTGTILGEQVQLQPQEELEVELVKAPEDLQETTINFWPWTKEEEINAMITEESSGHETLEGTQEPIIDLDTTATAQETKIPLPAAPSTDQVYILPASQSQHKTPAAPKAKSNSLHAMQNLKILVASVHTFATTSKKMANAYIAWHSGWFGCGFGFGTPGPRHF